MGNKLLLSDCETVQRETVQQVVLGRLDESVQVMICVGSNQKTLPVDAFTSSQKLGDRVDWHPGDGSSTGAASSMEALIV